MREIQMKIFWGGGGVCVCSWNLGIAASHGRKGMHLKSITQDKSQTHYMTSWPISVCLLPNTPLYAAVVIQC